MKNEKIINQMVRGLYETEKAVANLLNLQARRADNYPHVGKYLKKLLEDSQKRILRLQRQIQRDKTRRVRALEEDIDLLSAELNKRTAAILYQQ